MFFEQMLRQRSFQLFLEAKRKGVDVEQVLDETLNPNRGKQIDSGTQSFDAGAGKTIMAGLLIRELKLRGLA